MGLLCRFNREHFGLSVGRTESGYPLVRIATLIAARSLTVSSEAHDRNRTLPATFVARAIGYQIDKNKPKQCCSLRWWITTPIRLQQSSRRTTNDGRSSSLTTS